MPRFTAKYALDVINKVLATDPEESKTLWAILGGAVRGPDGDSGRAEELKSKYTNSLRSLAFPAAKGKSTMGGVTFASSPTAASQMLANLEYEGNVGSHLRRHLKGAAKALQDLGYTYSEPSSGSSSTSTSGGSTMSSGSLKGKFWLQRNTFNNSYGTKKAVTGKVEQDLGGGVYALRLFKFGTQKERHLRIVTPLNLANESYVFFNTYEGLQKGIEKLKAGKDLIGEASEEDTSASRRR